jgi:DNA-binding CsgD family transcriptional regulator
MNVFVLFINLLALGMGAAVIGLAYRMDMEYRLPPLHDYLIYLVLTVVSGFFDWIVVNLLYFFVPGVSIAEIDSIFHIFWDLIGFPCAMAAAGWLLFTLMSFLNMRPDRKRKRILAAPFLIMGLLSIVHVVPAIRNSGLPLNEILWITFTVILPVFHLVLLASAYILARKLRDGSEAFARLFIFLLFLGYSVWYALSLIPSKWHPSYHISILWFFLFLLPPTLLLRRRLNRIQRLETLENFTREALAPFFERFEFTEREKDVAFLLLKGKSYAAMKDELFVSLQTVKNHTSRIYRKSDVRNRVEFVNLVRNIVRPTS